MELSNLAICYEALQRTYRNSVVGYIRTTFTAAFGGRSTEELRKPFQKEWQKIHDSALERRKTGELTVELTDEFDLLGVNHLFNLLDVHYDLCCPSQGGDREQHGKEKTALLGWIKKIKNLRDPLSHPSDEDMPYEDAFVLLDCARRVLLKLNLESPAARVKEFMGRLSGRPLSVDPDKDPLEDRLPPAESIVVGFVGRAEELKRLWDWFDDPLSRRWLLAGEGGKGKSAIAFQFGREVKLRAPEPFQVVLWLSAKKRRFEEGAVISVEQDFHDCDSAATCLLREYGWLDEIDRPFHQRRERALQLLDSFPALVIVDDVDSLEGEGEDAIEFFTLNVPQTKSKVLFTSRRVVFGMANIATHVGGFSELDAEEFVRAKAAAMGIDEATITKAVVRDIVRIAEASPLYMGDLVRLLAVMPVPDTLKTWQERGGEEARRYALGRELELLSQDAKEVLVAASIKPGPVSFAEIEAVTGFVKARVSSALSELQRLFLVPKPRLVEGEQRFETNVNTRMLVRSVLGESAMFGRLERVHRAIAGELPKIGRREIAALVRQAMLHVRNREQPRAEALLLAGLDRFPNDPDLYGVLGMVYKSWSPRRVTDARERFHRASQLKSPSEDMYRHWSQMEVQEQEWRRAVDAAERGLKVLPESRWLLYWAGYALSRLGRELRAGLHLERAAQELGKAEDMLAAALRVAGVSGGPQTGDLYRALVLNSEAMSDPVRTQKFFDEWFEKSPGDPNADWEWERISRSMRVSRPNRPPSAG